MPLKRVEDWANFCRHRRRAIAPRSEDLQSAVGNRDRTVGIWARPGSDASSSAICDAIKIRVLLHGPYVLPEEAAAVDAEFCDMSRLLAASDVVRPHPPPNAETAGTFGARKFDAMRDGALFVDTARGGITRTDARRPAFRRPRRDRSRAARRRPAAMDMPDVRLTPHVAGSFDREVVDMTDLKVSEIERYAADELLLHEVTLADGERRA